jgi:predicted transposase YbfD/YdcC
MKPKDLPPALVFAFDAFADLKDPRVDRTKLHPLINVLVMALSGAIAGAGGWDELALFARGHLSWFATVLEVQNGAPSADTFRRVFEALDPRELEGALERWISDVSKSFAGEVVAIDGKSLKAAIKKAGSTTPLHLLHVWAVDQHLLLGQQRVNGAPGEVAAIPELLKRLKIEGAVVTADANGCTKVVTSAVREAKADYVLALKGNRGPLHVKVKDLFASAEKRNFRGVPTHRSRSKGHGRTEQRVVRALRLPERFAPDGWRDAKTAVMIDRTRHISGKTKTERHYYIASLEPDVEKLARSIRGHWAIENNLHWMLDVAFGEDSRRIRDERSAENHALICRIALMMLKRSPERLSVALKRKKAGWEPDYLSHLLTGGI